MSGSGLSPPPQSNPRNHRAWLGDGSCPKADIAWRLIGSNCAARGSIEISRNALWLAYYFDEVPAPTISLPAVGWISAVKWTSRDLHQLYFDLKLEDRSANLA
jgi:hypothetical protein